MTKLLPAKIREKSRKRRRSFTLIELIIVVAIVAIISIIVLFALNPVELRRQARDSNRFSDSQVIDLGISLLRVDTPNLALGNTSTTYISIPDPTAGAAGNNCSGVAGLPKLPPGWTYHCVSPSNYRKIDGTGWLPINFALSSAGAPFEKLPTDPTNTTEGNRFYTYVTDGKNYVFTLLQESNKYFLNQKASLKDRGTDPTRIEVGRNPLLWAQATGLIGYWTFDEGGGIQSKNASVDQVLAADLENGVSWTAGKINGGVRFDGVNDIVTVGQASPTNEPNFGARSFSYGGWANLETSGLVEDRIIFKGGGGTRGYKLSFVESNNELYASVTDNDFATVTANFIKNFIDNNWHHFFVVVDKNSSLLKLFVNGVQAAQTNIPGGFSSLTNTGQPLRFGQDALLRGMLDEVRIYDRTLTATEINQIYVVTR